MATKSMPSDIALPVLLWGLDVPKPQVRANCLARPLVNAFPMAVCLLVSRDLVSRCDGVGVPEGRLSTVAVSLSSQVTAGVG